MPAANQSDIKILALISHALNTYLTLDPESAQRMKQLEGKRVQVELKPLHLSFQCHFTNGNCKLSGDTRIAADTYISGTPLQLLGVSLLKSQRQSFFADDVTITGDTSAGQNLIDLFDSLDIDWEDHLASLIGDQPAYHAMQLAKRVGRIFSSTKESFKEDLNEYIHEEAEWLPTQENCQDFFTDIDIIRSDVERAEVRVKRLLSSL